MANFNINKVILGGRLTSDIELKQTTSGVPVAQFSLAVNRKYSKDGQQETDFISCTAWRQTAEFIAKYFRKGSSLCIVGSIQVRSWQDQNGQKRYATDVIVDEAMFVDSKGDSQSAGAESPMTYIPDAYATPSGANFEEVTDDGLPF
jgi:single-strand DNA-binding protein